jgi:DNA primase
MDVDEKPDIEAVLEYYAGIENRTFIVRQAAGRPKVNCPFHDDDHPSAVLDLENGRFRCYACDAPSGDSIDVIRGREGLGFDDAVQWARDHVGYEGGEVQDPSSHGRYRPAFGADDDD